LSPHTLGDLADAHWLIAVGQQHAEDGIDDRACIAMSLPWRLK
jgi:hypothetical protein